MSDLMHELQELEEQRMELSKQMDIAQYALKLEDTRKKVKEELTILKGKKFSLRKMAKDESISEKEKYMKLLEVSKISEEITMLQSRLDELDTKIKEIEYNSEGKHFNKYIVLANIRELLKTSDIKIGQIEKEAGKPAGYMSRLESKNNSTEPSLEFLVTAAQMLNISLDILLFVDLTALNPTEEYLVKFLQKMNQDTVDDKLDWIRSSADNLNRMEPDMNGYVEHPLFNLETFWEEGETEYPDQKTEIRFVSHSFDCNTYINGDCFSLGMKNHSTLYLMNISKAVYKGSGADAYAKEIWIYTPGDGVHFLVSNRDVSQISELVDSLYDTVSRSMKHPKIKKNVKNVLDAFMNGDLGENDDDGTLPFN